MRTIYRWSIPVDGRVHEIAAPPMDITKVTVNRDRDIEWWGVIDTDADDVLHEFHAVGTGHEVPPDFDVVGTADRCEGFVWHLARRNR